MNLYETIDSALRQQPGLYKWFSSEQYLLRYLTQPEEEGLEVVIQCHLYGTLFLN
jgi:hypothetical protein